MANSNSERSQTTDVTPWSYDMASKHLRRPETKDTTAFWHCPPQKWDDLLTRSTSQSPSSAALRKLYEIDMVGRIMETEEGMIATVACASCHEDYAPCKVLSSSDLACCARCISSGLTKCFFKVWLVDEVNRVATPVYQDPRLPPCLEDRHSRHNTFESTEPDWYESVRDAHAGLLSVIDEYATRQDDDIQYLGTFAIEMSNQLTLTQDRLTEINTEANDELQQLKYHLRQFESFKEKGKERIPTMTAIVSLLDSLNNRLTDISNEYNNGKTRLGEIMERARQQAPTPAVYKALAGSDSI